MFKDFGGIFLETGIDFTKMNWQEKFKSDRSFFPVKCVGWLSKVLSHLSYGQCFIFLVSLSVNNNRIQCTILMLIKGDIMPRCRSRNASPHSSPINT